jgi:toxin ParE1/3/4
MRFDVLLTEGAEHDLASIHEYLAETEGDRAAERLLQRLIEVAGRLSEFPERGSHPRELLALGIREYRQVMMRPYRIIYRIIGQQVVITVIADGRRDTQSLLARRLLSS